MSELEQFCILAKSQKGRACAALIQQVLSSKKIFVFGELLSIPSVQALSEGEFDKHHKTLQLFVFGTYSSYWKQKELYLDLNEVQDLKLKQLTIAALSKENKILSYDCITAELQIDNIRAVEDLVISAIYLGLVSGKLNQREKLFRVSNCIRRDVDPSTISEIISKLVEWKRTCRKNFEDLTTSSNMVQVAGATARQEQAETQRRGQEVKQQVEAQMKMEAAAGPILGRSGAGQGGARRDEDFRNMFSRPSGLSDTRSSKWTRYSAF